MNPPSQGSTSSSKRIACAFDFDPKSPSALLLATSNNNSNNNSNDENTSTEEQFSKFYSDDGLSCNTEETSTLMKLLDAREDYYQKCNTDPRYYSYDPQVTSKLYRRELVTCLEGWNERIQNQMAELDDIDDTDTNNTTNINTNSNVSNEREKMEKDAENLRLLEMTHMITHLSEIYLLQDSPSSNYNNNNNDNEDMLDANDDPTRNTSGIATADTVRYLRFNHIPNITEVADGILPHGMDLNDLLPTPQPEYYDPNSNNCNNTNDNGEEQEEQEFTPFWYIFRKLVLRGCLNDAWSILSNHSACRRCSGVGGGDQHDDKNENGTNRTNRYMDPTLKEDNEAFEYIRLFLLSAPIPAGRYGSNNDGFSGYDDNDDDDEEKNEDTNDVDQREEVFGIPPSAYKLWDMTTTTTSNTSSTSPSTSTKARSSIDIPLGFNIHAAMNHYDTWKSSLHQLLKTSTPIRNLTRRIPMLKTCLWEILLPGGVGITSGSAGGIRYMEDDSWAERLVGELLYVRPNVRKEDVYVRALSAMNDSDAVADGGDSQTQKLEIIISIMRENAGVVVESLLGFGGGSGAALPGAMLALLCNLLIESGRIDLSTLSFDIQTQLLQSAASAILSSFSEQNHTQVGVRLSARLLQPYITPDNTQICAFVAEMLGRHWPKNDTEARGLLDICNDSLVRGSRRILDACDSICFCRFSDYRRVGKVGMSVQWLLRGVECASKFVEGSKRGDEAFCNSSSIVNTTCFRHLNMVCSKTTHHVLDALVKYSSMEMDEAQEPKEVQNQIQSAIEIALAVTEDEVSHIVMSDPSIILLMEVEKISKNLMTGDYSKVAQGITKCLEERNDVGGAMITLSPPPLYGHFLSLALDVLTLEDKAIKSDETLASFDVQGIHILMTRYSQYSLMVQNGFDAKPTCQATAEKITSLKMNACLGTGLMRAFIDQNAALKVGTACSSASKVNQNLFGEEQEIENMLGPSL